MCCVYVFIPATYLYNTIAPVVSDLPDSPTEQQWQTWIDKWSKLSIEDFLRGTMYQAPDEPQLRPWPEAAINGYKVAIISNLVNVWSKLFFFINRDFFTYLFFHLLNIYCHF